MILVVRLLPRGVISQLALITATTLLASCGGGGGSGTTGTNTPAPITPPPITSAVITNGATSENNILYQDVAASAGGSMLSPNYRLVATLGQSTPAGDSKSAGYALVGGLIPD